MWNSLQCGWTPEQPKESIPEVPLKSSVVSIETPSDRIQPSKVTSLTCACDSDPGDCSCPACGK